MPALTAPTEAGTLAYLRISRNLDQEQVARLLGTTQATVSRWEAGARPRARHHEPLAKLYGIDQSELADAVERTRFAATRGRRCVLTGTRDLLKHLHVTRPSLAAAVN